MWISVYFDDARPIMDLMYAILLFFFLDKKFKKWIYRLCITISSKF